MPKPFALFGQIVIYAMVAVSFGYFSIYPGYKRFGPDQAHILISFSHIGQRKEACRKLTQEEIDNKQANMHRGEVCPRERLPVTLELLLAEELMFEALLPPTGIASDGASQVYRRFTVPSGPHRITARLRDSTREEGFDYEMQKDVELAAGEKYVIDFRSELGGFLFGTHLPERGRVQ